MIKDEEALTSSSSRKDGSGNLNISHQHPCVGLLSGRKHFSSSNYALHHQYLHIPAIQYLLKVSGFTPVHSTCYISGTITVTENQMAGLVLDLLG